MVKVKTHFNAHEFPRNYEKGFGPSLTIPDQTMSIQEIVRRFVKGLPVGGAKVPFYEDDDADFDSLDGRDIRSMDYAELHDLKLANEERIAHFRKSKEDKVKKDFEDKQYRSFLKRYEDEKSKFKEEASNG